jgi:hypothetical protein
MHRHPDAMLMPLADELALICLNMEGSGGKISDVNEVRAMRWVIWLLSQASHTNMVIARADTHLTVFCKPTAC